MGEVLPNSDRVGQCNKLVMANALPEGSEPATNRQSKGKSLPELTPKFAPFVGLRQVPGRGGT